MKICGRLRQSRLALYMSKMSSQFMPQGCRVPRRAGPCLRMLAVLAGNPQDINAFMDRMGLSGAGAFGAPAAPGGGAPPVADPEAAYASQLEQLQVCVSWTLSDADGAVNADAWHPLVMDDTRSFRCGPKSP